MWKLTIFLKTISFFYKIWAKFLLIILLINIYILKNHLILRNILLINLWYILLMILKLILFKILRKITLLILRIILLIRALMHKFTIIAIFTLSCIFEITTNLIFCFLTIRWNIWYLR